MKTSLRILTALLIALALSACAEMTTEPAPKEPPPSPEEKVLATAEFEGSGSYEVAGTATINDLDGKLTLRFADNFSSSSGPDLYVWLVKDEGDLSSALELGELKGNSGAQSYDLPEGTNLDEYSHVYIWCKRFSALFGRAAF